MLPHAKSGRARILAFCSEKRHPNWPAIPAAGEAGLKGYDAYSWNAVWAPAGTPAPLLEKLNESPGGIPPERVAEVVRKALTDDSPDNRYIVGADADGAYSPDGRAFVFRRLTGTGVAPYGTWDLLTGSADGTPPVVIASGAVYRGAPDWGTAATGPAPLFSTRVLAP